MTHQKFFAPTAKEPVTELVNWISEVVKFREYRLGLAHKMAATTLKGTKKVARLVSCPTLCVQVSLFGRIEL